MKILNITSAYAIKKVNSDRVYSIPLSKGIGADSICFKSANVDKEDAFALRNIKDLPCACCGEKMINEKDYSQFKAKDFEGPAIPVLKKLKPYTKYMRPTEKTVYNLLCRAARKDPQADLQTLIAKRYYFHLGRLEEKQLKIINNAIEKAKGLSTDTETQLIETVNRVKNIIFVEAKDHPQKRSRIINEFSALKNISNDKKQIEKILKEIEKLPSAKNDVDSFITKYRYRGNREIGQRLMSTAKPSLDHIKPAKKSGHDKFSNMLVMCEKCNSERGTIPYTAWFSIHPEMPKNIQKNIDKIIKEINEGRLEGFDNYPLEVKKTLFEVTQKSKAPYILNISKLKKQHSPNPMLS